MYCSLPMEKFILTHREIAPLLADKNSIEKVICVVSFPDKYSLSADIEFYAYLDDDRYYKISEFCSSPRFNLAKDNIDNILGIAREEIPIVSERFSALVITFMQEDWFEVNYLEQPLCIREWERTLDGRKIGQVVQIQPTYNARVNV